MAIGVSLDIQARIKSLGLLDPTDDREEEQHQCATRLDSIQGKRVGFLDNRKGNADVVLERVREVLEERYEIVTVISTTKWVFSAPATPEILEELATCDFVITAIGD
ncbi:MAG: hypothetical protein O2909_06460 [Chloroflexi bacterium]|nr:hypothetical protein [Chloroflexota bacterium]MDA1219068.1 hypothetical protein [Chloroflexota bacterium]